MSTVWINSWQNQVSWFGTIVKNIACVSHIKPLDGMSFKNSGCFFEGKVMSPRIRPMAELHEKILLWIYERLPLNSDYGLQPFVAWNFFPGLRYRNGHSAHGSESPFFHCWQGGCCEISEPWLD